jgi:endonuclease/exonuclease/phosphatase (EEP) superfamily protein YafD
METLFPWVYMMLQSMALAVVPAAVFAAVCLAIGVACGWGWHSLWLLPLGPLVVGLGWAVWGLSLPTTPAPQLAGTLRIAHANTLLYFNTDVGPKVAFAQGSGAEVVSLLEVNEALNAALPTLSNTYPFMANSGGRLPMVLLAKHPITRAQSWGPRAVLYHIARPQGAFYVLQVHPQSPYAPAEFANRNATLAQLAAALPTLPQPLIMVGDMNTTPWDSAFQPLLGTLQLAGGWRAYLPSFPRWLPITPIDAMLMSPHFSAARVQHMRVPGSDHLGLVGDFLLR